MTNAQDAYEKETGKCATQTPVNLMKHSLEYVRWLEANHTSLKAENEKLNGMIDNGLGWEDMKNDITYPPPE